MAHMIWKGAISFGLVHVPVQLYPATQSEKVGFNLLDKRTIDPIGYKQIKGQLYFECRNSWGPDWADHGYFWMPSSYLTSSDLASDFWVIQQVE